MRTIGEIDGIKVNITLHALQRMVEMKLSAETIRAIITDPDSISESRKYKGDRNYRKDRYALGTCMEDGCLVIKTAVYSSMKDWSDMSQSGELSSDRAFKYNTNLPWEWE